MEKSNNQKIERQTGILLDVLSPPLPVASPIGDAGAGVGVVPGIGSLAHDLDPELAVGEVAVVESEAEISVGRRRGAPGEV